MKAWTLVVLMLSACAVPADVIRPSDSEAVAEAISEADSAAVLPILRSLYPDAIEKPEVLPELEGSLSSLVSRIRYPEKARKSGIQGSVFVWFVVDTTGTVMPQMVIQGGSAGLDVEAARVVSTATFIPGRHEGKPVQVILAMPVRFRLKSVPDPGRFWR